MRITIGARASPLSKAQAQEVLEEIQKISPNIQFFPIFLESTGDHDLKTSLRTLNKTNFFTKEIDELLLSGGCQIAIHSAKDLPEPLPQGLKLIALTRGVNASDSLVLREEDTLMSLPPKALIATSSERREDAVLNLRKDLSFVDVRGMIQARLKLLEEGKVHGVVIAEAALIRLKLTHLNRIPLPGLTVENQGKLAILARENDPEMEALFRPLDIRKYPPALYLGPDLPEHHFKERYLIHYPLIEIKMRESHIKDWDKFTHVIFTSKNSVKSLFTLLQSQGISHQTLKNKKILALGQGTAKLLRDFSFEPIVSEEEQAEGIVSLIKKLPLKESYFFWPHSSLSRPLIEETLKELGVRFISSSIYDTIPFYPIDRPPFEKVKEIIFSSPSTVEAFFQKFSPPDGIKLTPIGNITAASLAKYTSIHQNQSKQEVYHGP